MTYSDETSAEEGVQSGENTARKETQLQELRDRLRLGQFGGAAQKPAVALLCQPGHYSFRVLLLLTLFVDHFVNQSRAAVLFFLSLAWRQFAVLVELCDCQSQPVNFTLVGCTGH